ncbi:MAG: hypothetical protein LBJ67_14920 [Planctomycetaceae bacterium]|jgi:hypothetical protein|nr:hypothetical protein [Planctomycetaceae bacterium]
MLACTLLVRELDKTSLIKWASVKLTTIGERCRVMLKESLRNVINWAIEQLDFTGKTAKRMQSLLARFGLAK